MTDRRYSVLGHGSSWEAVQAGACSKHANTIREETLFTHRLGKESELVAALADSSALISRFCPVQGPT